MNNVQLIGRTTKDIELRYTPQTQTAVGTFTLAVDRMKKEDGQKETDFVKCKVWGKRAEIMEKFIKKGHKVGITGRIETGSYEKDGVKHFTTEVIVEEFDFLEQKKDEQQPAASTYTETPTAVPDELPDGFAYVDDDIPF